MTPERAARQQLRQLLGEHEGVAGVLRDALEQGRIEGTLYWRRSSGCVCVLGTIAVAEGGRDAAYAGLSLAAGHRFLAVESWALDISPGDVPDAAAPTFSGPYRAAMLVQWIDEFAAERVAA